MIEYKDIKGFEFAVRTDTLDEYILKENCYERARFNDNDVWLDIGANIGMFSVRYNRMFKQVYAYEPDPTNYRLLEKNIALNHIRNCMPIPEAIVWDDAKAVDFYLNKKKNKGSHSMLVKRGREKITVPATNINTVLDITIANAIKMDVEGAEYELLKAIDRWDQIKELIFEYHINILSDASGRKLARLYNLLRKRGFDVHGKDPGDLGKNWQTIIHATR